MTSLPSDPKSAVDRPSSDTSIADLFLAAFGLVARKITCIAQPSRAQRQPDPRPVLHREPIAPLASPQQIAALRAMGVELTAGTSEAYAELILAWLRDPTDVAAANAVAFMALTRIDVAGPYWLDLDDHPVWEALQSEFNRRLPGRAERKATSDERFHSAMTKQKAEDDANLEKLRVGDPKQYCRLISERQKRSEDYDEFLRKHDPQGWARHRYHINKNLLARGFDPNALPGPIEPGLPVDRIAGTRFPRRGHTSNSSFQLH
jgi:hypothetical protein